MAPTGGRPTVSQHVSGCVFMQALQVSPQALQQAVLLKHHQQLLAQHAQAQASRTLNAQQAQTAKPLRFLSPSSQSEELLLVQALQVLPQALQQAMLLKHHQQLLAQHQD